MVKTRFQKSWSMRNLPDELWPQILSTLPVKSLLRFRSVSTSWLSLIDSPDFALLHLSRFPNNRLQSHLLLAQGNYGEPKCVIRCSESFKITARLASPHSDPQSIDLWIVVSSVDGLFMLKIFRSRGSSELMLWNPSIRKTRNLPPSPGISSTEMINVEFGFGFDPSVKDYKYVRLVVNEAKRAHLVAIYVVETNSWRTVEFRGCSGLAYSARFRSLCLRGVLYALAREHHSSLLQLFSFDLSNEVFASTSLPVEDNTGWSRSCHTQNLTMMNGGGSLALVDMSRPEGSVWVMENLGADFKSSIWTQRYTFSTMIPIPYLLCGSGSFLYLNKNDEMLVNWQNRVTCYNLETGKAKIIVKNILLECQCNTWPYVESLALH